MITPVSPLMTAYQADALNLLSQLQQLKDRIKVLDAEAKDVQKQLAVAFAAGDLDDYKDPDQPNTIRHDDSVFVFCPGRISYDFKSCADVLEKERALKEAKEISIALGLAAKKQGNAFWSVKN